MPVSISCSIGHRSRRRKMMTNLAKGLGLSTLVLGGAMGATVFAQTPATDQSAPPAATQSARQSSARSTRMTAPPTRPASRCRIESRGRFLGPHESVCAQEVGSSARSIRSRTAPTSWTSCRPRMPMTSRMSTSRATAGINNAMMAANTADQHAADAANTAPTPRRPPQPAPAPAPTR